MQRKTSSTPMYRLRIELQAVKPAVWRSLRVPGQVTLAKLHKAFQIAMGWTDSHLHEFEIKGQRYGIPDPDFQDEPMINERRVTLAEALTPSVRQFRYSYDFGDGWEHAVEVEPEGSMSADAPPLLCLAGANACPPEDVGGPYGYADFLAAIGNPKHRRHQEMLAWCGGVFDPAGFDLQAVNGRLRRVKI